jgi:hypothetical protein
MFSNFIFFSISFFLIFIVYQSFFLFCFFLFISIFSSPLPIPTIALLSLQPILLFYIFFVFFLFIIAPQLSSDFSISSLCSLPSVPFPVPLPLGPTLLVLLPTPVLFLLVLSHLLYLHFISPYDSYDSP